MKKIPTNTLKETIQALRLAVHPNKVQSEVEKLIRQLELIRDSEEDYPDDASDELVDETAESEAETEEE